MTLSDRWRSATGGRGRRIAAALVVAAAAWLASPGEARAGSPCLIDFDQSGTIEVADIFAFMNAWFAGDPSAQFDANPGLQVSDIFAFLNAWFAGCS
jgi:hypothetical protein